MAASLEPHDVKKYDLSVAPFEAAWLVAGATDTSIETPAGGRALALHFLANIYILGRSAGKCGILILHFEKLQKTPDTSQ